MNNFDRNTRTLIVSFVIAIFALIPLRFIEVGSQQNFVGEAQVLGETISNPINTLNEEEQDKAKLEAPYDAIDYCVDKSIVTEKENEVVDQLQNGDLSKDQITVILDELRELEANICQN
jgi:hypothetical protein